jgi:uncharacterized repeat protein (TIGR01451 family)
VNYNEKKLIDKNGASLNWWRQIARKCLVQLLAVAIISLGVMGSHAALADTPVTLYKSFAGNINITGTAGTLRTAADPTYCTVANSGSMQLLGVPAGSTIVAAYLYWAGSGGDPKGGAAADYNVTFNGYAITADRTFTASFNHGGTDVMYFFQGMKDVTSGYGITGNGTYNFSNLTVRNADVNNGGQYCTYGTVLSAFSLVVVYSNPSEILHVVNLWDGFQTFYGGAIALTPSNFIVPSPAPITALSARHLVLTWEGDSGNSGALNGYNENLTFCAPAPCAGTALTDTYNPLNNQFNSTVDVPPNGPFSGINTTWGVDFDLYDITSMIHAGNASAQAIYSSGADLVILANQTMSIPNVDVADLAITKTHNGNFTVGANGVYTLNVMNSGPSPTSGTITVTDTLPTGLAYISGTGTGWTCVAVGQAVTCTRPSPLVSGASAPSITLTVSVGAAAYPSVTNTATVSSGTFDNHSADNTASDPTTVGNGPNITVVKSRDKATASPGDIITYTATVTNTGLGAAPNVVVIDSLSSYIQGGLNSYGAGVAFQFVNGAPSSGLALGTPVYSSDHGSTWTYTPVSGGGGAPAGYDGNITNWSIPMTGTMNANGANFNINYKVRVE